MEHEERLRAALADRYQIEREIGSGGMATVYLAQDLKHDRKVAVKVLKPELAAVVGTERFLAEIRTTANLSHPHILPLFDSGEADGLLFYVMPFVDGESLREKLDREKQLSVDEAVRLAMDVAEALGAAHEQGVIHRDIKPANILLSRGKPLVADFGIALALTAAGGSRLTETGLSVGSPHYMSPEQATGDLTLGPATDTYALGCVLYEMLVGEPPYTGSTAQAILSKILVDEPKSVTAQRKSVPVNVDATISKALEKLPADRFSTVAQFSAALSDPGFSPAPDGAWRATPHHRELLRWRRVAATLTLVAVLMGVVSFLGWRRSGPESVTKVIMGWQDGSAPTPSENRFALSPDGSRFAYVGGDGQIWVRDLDELAPRLLPGTADAANPFFSPDGESIAFVAGRNRALKIAPIEGGTVRTLVADSADIFGGDWGRDGMLYFTDPAGPVKRVASVGGPVESVSRLDTIRGDLKHDWVDVLPSGKGALVSIWRGSGSSSEIGLLDLATGEVTTLFPGTQARFVVSGHILYATYDGTLQVVPFDQNRLTTAGPAVSVVENLEGNLYGVNASFGISDTGTLVYRMTPPRRSGQAVWVEKDGNEKPVDPDWQANFFSLALSPDGRQIVATLRDQDRQDIWVKQLDTGSLNRLTFEGQGSLNYRPEWTPDGESVTFCSNRSGATELWLQRADGSTPAERLLSDGPLIDEGFLAPRGGWLVYRAGGSNLGSRDIRAIQLGEDSVPVPVVSTPSDDYSPTLSPDGRWLAYVSEESGRPEVYVRPFPEAEGVRWQVSSEGGMAPVWNRTGGQLFYQAARGELMAVDVTDEPTFEWGSPRVLFDASGYHMNEWHSGYDVSPDGERFLMVRDIEDERDNLILVLNWFTELEELVGR